MCAFKGFFTLAQRVAVEGFGTIRCRHMKNQPYIHVNTAIGIMKIRLPAMSMIFLVV